MSIIIFIHAPLYFTGFIFGMLSCGIDSRLLAVSVLFVLTYIPESWFCLFISLMSRKKMIAAMANKMEAA